MYIVDLKYLITVTVELKLKLDISTGIFELVTSIGGTKLGMVVLFMGFRKIQIQYKLKHNTQMINDTV